MQFQVPQFLDVEDKIIGPFTLKQFLYLAGTIGLGYLSFHFIPLLGIPIAVIWVIFGFAMAFYKFNNKPLVFVLEAAFHYMQSSRFYVWRRIEKPNEQELDLRNFHSTQHVGSMLANKSTANKLGDMTWSISVEQTKEVGAKKVLKDSNI